MSQIGNKAIMAANIQRLMKQKGKDRNAVCSDLGFRYTTFTDWVKGEKYPRIDKIEMMAAYFGVSKSELIEEYKEKPVQKDRLVERIKQLTPLEREKAESFIDGLLSNRGND